MEGEARTTRRDSGDRDEDDAWLQLGLGRCRNDPAAARGGAVELDLLSSTPPPATHHAAAAFMFRSPLPPPLRHQPLHLINGSFRLSTQTLAVRSPPPPPPQIPHFPGTPPPPGVGASSSPVEVGVRAAAGPPGRPHSGVWCALQASRIQGKEPFLPQIQKSYLRIKDGKMPVRLFLKYLVKKLGLQHESQVEIWCRGQRLPPLMTMQHVRDHVWRPPTDGAAVTTLQPDSSVADHLMVLHYGWSAAPFS